MDFEKIKDFFLEKKGLVIGIVAVILIGGYFIQKNNQPAIRANQWNSLKIKVIVLALLRA